MDRKELAQSLLQRFQGLESVRQPWVPTWQELTEYMLPRKNSFSHTPKGQTSDERIFDSTPMHALELLASALGGLLTNPAIPWFDIRVKDKDLEEDEAVRDFLGQAGKQLTSTFNAEDTGFQTNVHELYLDIALLGTAVMYVEADPQSMVRFSTRPLGEVFVAESARGMVDTVYRRYELPARRVWREWKGACSDDVRSLAEKKPDTMVEILHAVFPRTDRDPFGIGAANFPYASVYLEIASQHVLEESGYLEMPYLVPRWAKAAGETYGRGPGATALSDTRVLNAMSRTALMAAEKMSDPPLMVPDDGFLGPVRSGPGGLSYYRAGSSDRIEALPVRVDLNATENMIQQRRESIRRIFLGDQLAPEGPAVTATEAVMRQSDKMRVLGPVLGRLQTEFLGPLIKRVFNIMLRAGELPPLPEGLTPDDLEVRYTSPVARAQQQYEAQSLPQVLQHLAPIIGSNDPFGIMDNFDTDQITRRLADLYGTPGEFMRSRKEMTASREEAAESLSATQMTRAMNEVTNALKTLSESYTDRPNVLTELWSLVMAGKAQPSPRQDSRPADAPSARDAVPPEQEVTDVR